MKYNIEKFQRLRNRARQLNNELQLISDDTREHLESKRVLQLNLETLEKNFPSMVLDSQADKSNVDGHARAKAKAVKDLEAATEIVDRVVAEKEALEESANRANALVSSLESSIEGWGLQIPPETRVNSPGMKRFTGYGDIENISQQQPQH